MHIHADDIHFMQNICWLLINLPCIMKDGFPAVSLNVFDVLSKVFKFCLQSHDVATANSILYDVIHALTNIVYGSEILFTRAFSLIKLALDEATSIETVTLE